MPAIAGTTTVACIIRGVNTPTPNPSPAVCVYATQKEGGALTSVPINGTSPSLILGEGAGGMGVKGKT